MATTPVRKKELLYYLDDSGSRDPDRHPRAADHEPDWFALGGVIVAAEDKAKVEDSVCEFRRHWPQLDSETPFRSYNIRNRTGGFRWLSDLAAGERREFFDQFTDLMLSLPVVVAGCVVHRPGYNARYFEQYGQRRWKLCRTAFNIAVERAAKFAVHQDSRLRVFIERSDRETERHMKTYYDELRASGPPFNPETSAQYRPLAPGQLTQALFEFGVRTKRSTLMQLADVMLWPVCKGGYKQDEPSYAAIRERGLLLDARCDAKNGLLGIKYSCFDQKP